MLIIFLKGCIIGLFALVAVFFHASVLLGRKNAGFFEKSGSMYDAAVAKHKRFADYTIRCTVIAILITETIVRVQGGFQHKALLIAHLCFSVPFLLTLIILRLWQTGLKNKKTHRFLGYTSAVFLVMTLITGSILLFTKSAEEKLRYLKPGLIVFCTPDSSGFYFF